jgi:hypothetical protein
VVFAGVGHQPVVFGGQGGVEPAGVVSGEEQRLAQHGVAPFGRSTVPAGHAGGVQGGDQAGVGTDTGQRGEPSWIAKAAEDRRAGDGSNAGRGGDDAGRVGVGEQHADALVEVVDLLRQRQREPGFDGDVLG